MNQLVSPFSSFLLLLGQERPTNHHNATTAMAAMAASAAATGQNAFFGQYPGLFDPSRTSHLADWHLHSASFHNAQGKLFLFFGFYFQNCVLIYEL